MGVFSPTTTVSVASSVYNLSGEVANRIDYLKPVVVGSVLSDNNNFIGEDIVNSLLNGPSINQRIFFNWADDNYSLGTVNSNIRNALTVSNTVVAGQLSPAAGETVRVENAFIEDANFGYFAEQYIYENNPSLINTAWVSDYNPITEEVTIQYADNSTVTFSISGYDREAQYLIVYFQYVTDYAESGVLEGTLVTDIATEAALPSTSGYALDQDWTFVETVSIDVDETTHILIEYSDATPDDDSTSTVTTTLSYDVDHQIYIKETYIGADDVNNRTVTLREIRNFFSLSEIDTNVTTDTVVDSSGPVTTTTTTTVTTETLIDTFSYRDDTQEIYYSEINGGTQMLIYKMGGANTVFNALVSVDDTPPTEFYKYIPLRVNNVGIEEAQYAGTFYNSCAETYKKLTSGGDIADVLTQISSNPDVDDIDYATLMFGVSLNVASNSSKKYIYDFLQMLIPFQIMSYTEYEDFVLGTNNYETAQATYLEWLAAQGVPADPLFNTTAPPVPSVVNPQYTTLRLNASSFTLKNYDLRLSWATIKEDNFNGVHISGASPGDVRLAAGTANQWDVRIDGNNQAVSVETLLVFRQVTANTYTRLTCKGLYHENYVYDGNKVAINSTQALNESGESGFIIPMHAPTLRAMSLVDSTQVSMENVFILFNSFLVTTQQWWQTGFFQIIIFIGVAVAFVLFAPAGVITGGILGANLAVGGVIGLGGTAALVAGAVANAIAAIILIQIITAGATAIFGEKWGSVIGVIAGFIAMQGMTSFATGGQLGMNWGSMMRADNLMRLTQVGADAYSGWVRGDILEIEAEMVESEDEYEKASREIKELQEAFGMGGRVIDPMMFTDISSSQYTFQESPDTFIKRSTMVGSDIIDLSFAMIYDYVEMNLTLPSR